VYANVNVTGGLGDGSSWANAYPNLQEAVVRARNTSCEVWVAAGVYTTNAFADQSLIMSAGVEIYGGFQAGDVDFSQRDPRTDLTILDGTLNSQRVVICDVGYGSGTYGTLGCDSGSILDGFVVMRGNWGFGNGATIGTSSTAQAPTFANVTFTDNTGTNGGGAVALTGGAAIFDKCTFASNESTDASSNGGAIWSANNTAIDIFDSIFVGNRAGTGGAIYAQGELYIENSAFGGNWTFGSSTGGGTGGAVWAHTGALEVLNSTFSFNVSDSYGGAIWTGYNNASILNSIVWGNAATSGGADV